MLKRAIDLCGALVGVVVLSPILLVVALLVLVAIGRPVIFAQTRPGRHARLFRIYKFRTMSNGRDADGALLADVRRLSRIGKLLRGSSLDELPELWNVLRGDMSLVGPRPLLVDYLHHYTATQARRHEVKPGITGWAQINGRNALSWNQRFDLDIWYVDHHSTLLDMKILALTLWRVIRRDGVTPVGREIMPRFDGADERSTACAALPAQPDHDGSGPGLRSMP